MVNERLKISILLFVFLLSFTPQKGYTQPHNKIENTTKTFHLRLRCHSGYKNVFHYQVLIHALKLTEENYGPFSVEIVDLTADSSNRRVMELKKSNLYNIDLIPATEKIENELIPIRFPIFKGNSGLRILAVREEMAAEISQCKTLEELQQYTFGHGKGWYDTPILTVNGFRVVTSDDAQSLYKMLMKGRFDCFPRSIYELNSALQSSEITGIKAVESFLLYYPYPNYLFVSPDKPEIAQRVFAGLQMANQDGSFDRMFLQHYAIEFKNVITRDFRIIHLENPYISEESLQILQTHMLPELKQLIQQD